MKKFFQIGALMLLFVWAAGTTGCKSSKEYSGDPNEKPTMKASKSMVKEDVPARNMAELIGRQPNVVVSGSGSNVSFQIRGRRSFTSTNEPLFIVDGMNMGHDYQRIANIDPKDVRRVNIVRDPADLVAYGSQGANGVIEIYLNK